MLARAADEIDAACNAFQAQNYSFAHKKSARTFNKLIADARKVASASRHSFAPFRGESESE
jgi:hypothetical protein